MGQNLIEYSNKLLSHFTWTTKYSEYQHLGKVRISLFEFLLPLQMQSTLHMHRILNFVH